MDKLEPPTQCSGCGGVELYCPHIKGPCKYETCIYWDADAGNCVKVVCSFAFKKAVFDYIEKIKDWKV